MVLSNTLRQDVEGVCGHSPDSDLGQLWDRVFGDGQQSRDQ